MPLIVGYNAELLCTILEKKLFFNKVKRTDMSMMCFVSLRITLALEIILQCLNTVDKNIKFRNEITKNLNYMKN